MTQPPVGASWSTVRHRGTWTDLDMLTRLPGQWSLSIPVDITNSADDVIIPAFTKRGNLSTANGQPSLDLLIPVVDDPDNLPSGTFYFTLKVSVQGTPERTFYLQPTMAQADANHVVNLRLLVPNLPPPAVDPSEFFGGPGGVPGPLDADGWVPLEQINPAVGSGGGGGGFTNYSQVAALSGYPATFPPTTGTTGSTAAAGNDPRLSDARTPTTHSHPTSQVTGLDSALAGKAAASHTHPSSQITDFTEAVQDAVGALLQGSSGVSVTYDDANNTLTITGGGAGGLDAEGVRDAIGVALLGTGAISVVANDAADTITISTTATQNSTDAQLRDRSTHTGSQSLDTTTDSTANAGRLAMTNAERTKLGGVATGATANSTDAQLRDRTTHTGTIPYNGLNAGAAHIVSAGLASRPTAVTGVNFIAYGPAEPAWKLAGDIWIKTPA